MVWIEGLQECIGTELGLIITTPEYNKKSEQAFYDYHNWFWRKLQRFRPMRFRFNSPPKYKDKGKTGAIIIPDIQIPNSIHSLWGEVIGINYQNGKTFDYPNATEQGLCAYGLIPERITSQESPIIRIEGQLVLDSNHEDTRAVNVYTNERSTRASNLHYILRDMDKFLKEPE